VRCGVSQKCDVGPRPPFIRISQARSGTVIQISRPLWASIPECDAHICLNLGFTSQNFRLSQVSLRVCYFWWSFFRMDEGNSCLVSTGSATRDGQFKSSRRNRRFFCFSSFYEPCNHPNLHAVIILGLRIVRPSVTVSLTPRASSLETERKTGLAISILATYY
jgi:hypothetical protein